MKKLYLLFCAAMGILLSQAQNVPYRETTPIPTELQHFNSASLPNGDVLVFGGTAQFPNASNKTWRYNWQTETWTQLADMVYPVAQAATITFENGDIFCIGGTKDFSGKEQRSQIFELNTMQWREVGGFDFFNPIYTGHFALSLPGDYVLLSTTNADFSIYLPGSETWTDQDAPAPLDAGGSTTVLLDNGEILFTGAGGQIFIPNAVPTGGNLFYLDPPENDLYQQGVVKLLNGEVVTMDLQFSFGNALSIYDPVSRTATDVSEIPYNGGTNARSAILMPDGKVLTFGFGDITQPTDTKLIQVYDPENNSWSITETTEVGPLSSPKLRLLPDSSVFAISTTPEIINGQATNRTWILNRDNTTAVEEEKIDASLRVYPNPAKDWLKIDGEELLPVDTEFALYTAFGQLVNRWKNISEGIQMNHMSLSGGIYFYQITDANGKIIKKDKLVLNP